MIPKLIHYCWFGGKEKPELAFKCIDSWRKNCPDYEIMEWNETNFDVGMFDYTKEAYSAGRWAFVTDVVRLYALVNYGGIYMDTDVEVLKPLDSLLQYSAVSGFETEFRISTGLMGCEKGYEFFSELLNTYRDKHFMKENGELDLTTNVVRITNQCLEYGLILNNKTQTIRGFTLLPTDYLCPKDFLTGETHITTNTLCIHHFDGSWRTEEEKLSDKYKNMTRKILPHKLAGHLAYFLAICKVKGIRRAFSVFIHKIWKC